MEYSTDCRLAQQLDTNRPSPLLHTSGHEGTNTQTIRHRSTLTRMHTLTHEFTTRPGSPPPPPLKCPLTAMQYLPPTSTACSNTPPPPLPPPSPAPPLIPAFTPVAARITASLARDAASWHRDLARRRSELAASLTCPSSSTTLAMAATREGWVAMGLSWRGEAGGSGGWGRRMVEGEGGGEGVGGGGGGKKLNRVDESKKSQRP